MPLLFEVKPGVSAVPQKPPRADGPFLTDKNSYFCEAPWLDEYASPAWGQGKHGRGEQKDLQLSPCRLGWAAGAMTCICASPRENKKAKKQQPKHS